MEKSTQLLHFRNFRGLFNNQQRFSCRNVLLCLEMNIVALSDNLRSKCERLDKPYEKMYAEKTPGIDMHWIQRILRLIEWGEWEGAENL